MVVVREGEADAGDAAGRIARREQIDRQEYISSAPEIACEIIAVSPPRTLLG